MYMHVHTYPEEVGHISAHARASIDYNIRPRNPGQPAESAKHVHYIRCAGIKIKFAKIVTNLL